MDRALKERIIGAVVLVAVVVLVVPVFLDGPPEEVPTVSESISLPGQETDGTRTIVLERDRSEPVPAVDAAGPAGSGSDEVAGQEPASQSPPEEPSPEAPRREAAAEPVPDTSEVVAAGQADASLAIAPTQAEPEPVIEGAAQSSTGMWAVQLGSFSSEANAERLAAELRQAGFAAFLSTLQTANGELHRVRVGPQRDREAAEAMLARLRSSGQKGQVVPHP